MKLAIIGYGKMGKMVEDVAIKRGHDILHIIDKPGISKDTMLQEVDAAIEFTQPKSVIQNIESCFRNNCPLITGTTGWHDELNHVKDLCQKHNGSLFYASNFSLGVNVLFRLNRYLAEMMNKQESYEVLMEESHHKEKLDAPSGTAVTLAEDLLKYIKRKNKWKEIEFGKKENISSETTPIYFKREEGEIGEHKILYKSEIDEIEIRHKAFNRKGFAEGAVKAAEWLNGKTGIYTMDDLFADL